MGNCEILGKHAHAMNVSRKKLKLTRMSSVPGSRVTLPETVAFIKAGYH